MDTNDKPIKIADDRLDLRILQAFRRIIRAIDLHSRKLVAGFKITGPQLWCLLAIEESGPITSVELSRRVNLSPSTIVGILDRLEEKGLLIRERSIQDRRRVFLKTTDAGRALARKAPLPLQERLIEALRKLPEVEQRTITDSLEKVVEMLHAESLSAAPVLETGPIQGTDDKAASEAAGEMT